LIWIVEALLAGSAAFAATNVDDILILMLFFARVNGILQRRHIVTGQYLGFLVLIAASLPGFLGGLIVPKVWLGWLGLIPIAIGLHLLLQFKADEVSVQTISLMEFHSGEVSWRSLLTSILSPPTYQVAAVTIANGGDNVAIYIPLFANSSLAELVVILSGFLVMVAIWCGIAFYLAKHPLLSQPLTRYGHRLLPFVLIGLGIFIVMDSESYRLVIP
jgi:cadmium resistance transport/sequestration family protein